MNCRSCQGTDLTTVLDLGSTPLADRLVPPDRLEENDPLEPLEVVLCRVCGLVQITKTVDPTILFASDYPYYSSVSPELLRHARAHAIGLIERHSLGTDSFVVEIASNDGYLLRNFTERGINVLGIDPADGPVGAARSIGVPTHHAFFARGLAQEIVRQHGQADVIVANNVLAHVADLRGFVAGMIELLAPGGALSIEVPYLVDLVDRGEFDTIYHQHLCYFSVKALHALFQAEGLSLTSVTPLSIHGGSIRLRVEREGTPDGTVQQLLDEEARRAVHRIEFYEPLRHHCENLRTSLLSMLRELKNEGHQLAGYGAAAKATTLMSYCSIDDQLIDFIVDRNPKKHGMRMPGCRIPVVPVETLLDAAPAYTLLLAWNFADEIIAQQSEYIARGGKFIVPIPQPRIWPAP